MTNEQIRKPLPDSLMKAIRATVASPDMSAQEKLEAVVLMANGFGLWAAQTKVWPTHYAMPDVQWGEVAMLLQSVPDGSVDRVNVALDWMNLGPSGYKP